ncbi:hypothetical protein E4T56_gene2163 [Termitomyces sp. T112]|nr:hypothetical protein E4T56_gene2163 [Termitomyces sp. T112]
MPYTQRATGPGGWGYLLLISCPLPHLKPRILSPSTDDHVSLTTSKSSASLPNLGFAILLSSSLLSIRVFTHLVCRFHAKHSRASHQFVISVEKEDT